MCGFVQPKVDIILVIRRCEKRCIWKRTKMGRQSLPCVVSCYRDWQSLSPVGFHHKRSDKNCHRGPILHAKREIRGIRVRVWYIRSVFRSKISILRHFLPKILLLALWLCKIRLKTVKKHIKMAKNICFGLKNIYIWVYTLKNIYFLWKTYIFIYVSWISIYSCPRNIYFLGKTYTFEGAI